MRIARVQIGEAQEEGGHQPRVVAHGGAGEAIDGEDRGRAEQRGEPTGHEVEVRCVLDHALPKGGQPGVEAARVTLDIVHPEGHRGQVHLQGRVAEEARVEIAGPELPRQPHDHGLVGTALGVREAEAQAPHAHERRQGQERDDQPGADGSARDEHALPVAWPIRTSNAVLAHDGDMLVQAVRAGGHEWTAGGGCEKDDRRMISLPPRPALPWLFGIVGVIAVSVLAYNTRILRDKNLTNLEYAEWVDGQVYSMASWRFWDDAYVAVSRYLDWKYGTKRRPGNPDEDVAAVKDVLVSKTGEAGIRPYEFWRTIRDAPFLRVQRQTWIPPLEDPGRPILIAAGFTLLGGVSPYLLIWIGTLASIPALLWILGEARASHVPLAGSLFVALCVSSPFVVESLSLPHSPVAFYLIAAFILIAFGLYAFLGERGSLRGLLVRASAASLGFAVCCTCRAGALVMAPAFGLAVLFAAGRVCPRRFRGGLVRQCLLAALLTGVFVVPYLVLRPPQHHNFWISYWEGLGDYGTDRGYSWYDRDLKRWLAARGRTPFEHPRYVSHDDDVYVGQAVRRDILAHPAWFAAVLGRRFVDTVSLAKLGPHGAWDGWERSSCCRGGPWPPAAREPRPSGASNPACRCCWPWERRRLRCPSS